jgi:hypothetical protein
MGLRRPAGGLAVDVFDTSRPEASRWHLLVLAGVPTFGLALRACPSADYDHAIGCCRSSLLNEVFDLVRHLSVPGTSFELIYNFGVEADIVGLGRLMEFPV